MDIGGIDVGAIEMIATGGGGVGGLLFYHMKASAVAHQRTNQKVIELENEVIGIKSKSMTEEKVRQLMHEQIDPIRDSVQRIDRNTEKIHEQMADMSKMFTSGMEKMKEDVYLLNVKTAVTSKELEIRKGDDGT